jgi:hypothetical protein
MGREEKNVVVSGVRRIVFRNNDLNQVSSNLCFDSGFIHSKASHFGTNGPSAKEKAFPLNERILDKQEGAFKAPAFQKTPFIRS